VNGLMATLTPCEVHALRQANFSLESLR
jgi:hypothetical protein